MTTNKTVPFYGKLSLFEVGQFKPVTIIPQEGSANVAIDVPLNEEYVYNISQFSEENNPEPIWTRKGVQFIFNKLDSVLNFEKPEEVDEW